MKKIKNNLKPNSNIEYIYNIDTVWCLDKVNSFNVEKGIIVENVIQVDSGGYVFNIKGNNEKYQCFYGWAFIENNVRNRDLLEEMNNEIEILNKQNLKVKKIRNCLDKLYKSENVENERIDE
jgi:hypothetical protein